MAVIVLNFGTKFLFRRGECKTRENSKFWKKGKIVISITKLLMRLKILNLFSRSRMMKRISPLESSREIYLARKISQNSKTVGADTFYEASQLGCSKSIFDATKVTYNTYSRAISGVSREIMKMDGRDNAEYQIWEIN